MSAHWSGARGTEPEASIAPVQAIASSGLPESLSAVTAAAAYRPIGARVAA
jgi:hypothetical protein